MAALPADVGAERTLDEVCRRFQGEQVVLACSFQKESSVLLDLVVRRLPGLRVITLDTGELFPETYETWHRFEAHFGVTIEAWRGEWSERMWVADPDGCCRLRKVGPLSRALEGARCWIAGLRREHSPLRSSVPELHWDSRHGLWKSNPLATWSEADVWRHIRHRRLPYHPLHDRGYASIGCTHCTRPGAGREGRWPGSAKSECGLHPIAFDAVPSGAREAG